MNKSYYENYDSINWNASGNKNELLAGVGSNGTPQGSFLEKILIEKEEALKGSYHVINNTIPLFYELQGLLAWFSKCPAREKRDTLDVIDERYVQILKQLSLLEVHLNTIKKP